MKLLLITAASLIAVVVVLVAVAAIIGSRLPASHEALRSVVVNASPSAVYAVLTDVANAASWRRELQRVDVLGVTDGHLRFREHGAHGAVTYEVVKEEPARLLVTEIVDRDLGYSGSWTYTLAPEGNATRLTITERGVVSNIFFRFMSRYVFGHTKTMETYLASLDQHLRTQS